MTDKLQEITEKIYLEGVIKAKKTADQILEDAKTEAARIIKSAKEEALTIVHNSKTEAAEVRKNTESEMKLAARQFISQLKKQVVALIAAEQIETPVRDAFSDKEFVKKLILTIVENWEMSETGEIDLNILLPEKDKAEFSEFLKTRAVEAMNKGLKIQADTKMKDGFKIGPGDESYVIRFTDADFDNYFKSYFTEKTRKLLFNDE